jgi:3-oxoacyl-[acyl-carrier protein] reductase
LLVNNASVTPLIPLGDLEAVKDEVWDTILAVNVMGMFYSACGLAPYVNARGRDAIVNVGSIAGLTGNGSSLPHAVSKAAVAGLTKSLAHALAPEIRVCCVAPGIVATRWWKGREEKIEHLRREALLRRTTTPEDVAELSCTLLEQEAITGQTSVIDSGQTI